MIPRSCRAHLNPPVWIVFKEIFFRAVAADTEKQFCNSTLSPYPFSKDFYGEVRFCGVRFAPKVFEGVPGEASFGKFHRQNCNYQSFNNFCRAVAIAGVPAMMPLAG